MAKSTHTAKATHEDQTVTVPYGNTVAAQEEVRKEVGDAIEETAKDIQKESETPLTETEAKEAARAIAIPEHSGYSLGNLATSEALTRTNIEQVVNHPNDVKFEVTDPQKTGMPKGIVVVSKETAEHFKSIGIGKIVD